MAGAIADRELASAPRFLVAGPEDDADIRRLLRENAMPGEIPLTLEREPDYFAGAHLAGGQDQTILARTAGRLVCVGRCTVRRAWVNGRPAPVGYLAELRLDAVARGRFPILRAGYRFFHEHAAAAPVAYFTSISAENGPARRLLESGARGLPRYEYLGELATLLVPVPRRPTVGRWQAAPVTPAQRPHLARLLQAHGRSRQLAPVWTEKILRTLGCAAALLQVRENGVPMGGAVLWDQRGFRQTVIQSYPRWMAWMRPAVNAVARMAGRPGLPRPGVPLAQLFLSPLALEPGAEPKLPELVAACLAPARAAGAEFLTLALPAEDARLPALQRRFRPQLWRSRLYQVVWPGAAPCAFAGGPFWPDVSLL